MAQKLNFIPRDKITQLMLEFACFYFTRKICFLSLCVYIPMNVCVHFNN